MIGKVSHFTPNNLSWFCGVSYSPAARPTFWRVFWVGCEVACDVTVRIQWSIISNLPGKWPTASIFESRPKCTQACKLHRTCGMSQNRPTKITWNSDMFHCKNPFWSPWSWRRICAMKRSQAAWLRGKKTHMWWHVATVDMSCDSDAYYESDRSHERSAISKNAWWYNCHWITCVCASGWDMWEPRLARTKTKKNGVSSSQVPEKVPRCLHMMCLPSGLRSSKYNRVQTMITIPYLV